MGSKIILSIWIIALLVIGSSIAIPGVFATGPPDKIEAYPPKISKIPVVVLFKVKPTAQEENDVQSNEGEITKSYNIINGFAANLPQAEIDKLKKDPSVISVDPDVQVHALDLSADTQIRADQVWATGDTGTGIPVAILDTGIDTTHPEFSGRILKCHSEITNTNTCTDGNGHGTHTSGIAGAAGVNPNAKGVAPAVSLYSDQVLDSTGSGTISEVIAGIDWATANGAKIISMSLGTNPLATSQPNCDTAIPSLTTAINNAVAAGVTVVAAAGNSGRQGVGAPGCISSTIAVGAVDSTDTIASFSSTGGPMTDHGIVAPGVNIFSSVPTGSCQLCDPSGYLYLSGTSMATPHVAGTIALMLKANPGLLPATIRSTLFNTACTSSTTPSCPTGTVPNSVYGYGRVDALRAYNAVATPPPPPPPNFSLSASPNSLTIQQGLSGSSTITVSSLNGFNSAVTLAVIAPSGISGSVSPTSVTPTSGGSATSTLSITVPSTTATGTYTITVTGTSGSLIHSTSVSVTVTAPPPPDFSISANPSSLAINAGSSGTSTVTISSLNGFSGTVSLTTSSPAAITASLNPSSIAVSSGGSGSSTLLLAVASSATAGAYTVTVTGTSGSLTHSASVTVNVQTVPSPPQNLQATAGNTQVTLSWQAPSSSGGSSVTYNVYRGLTSGGEGTTPIATGVTSTSYTDTGLTNAQTYYYTVKAVNSVGQSAPSNEASATPVTTPVLSVVVSSDKSTYSQSSFAQITVTVTSNSVAVSGASVTLTVTNPNGGTSLGSGTTNSSGQVTFQYHIGKHAPTGTYTASATAAASGYISGSGSATFQVT